MGGQGQMIRFLFAYSVEFAPGYRKVSMGLETA
jgi:hypothetical protein